MSWHKKDKPNILGKTEQLCWACVNATGNCAWSEDLIPIPGWDADEDRTSNGDITYKIRDCPLYTPQDKGGTEVVRDRWNNPYL